MFGGDGRGYFQGDLKSFQLCFRRQNPILFKTNHDLFRRFTDPRPSVVLMSEETLNAMLAKRTFLKK